VTKMLLFTDPPEHDRLRRAVGVRYVTRRGATGLERERC